MPEQSEEALERKLIEDLQARGYEYIRFSHKDDSCEELLLQNLKKQIEIHNKLSRPLSAQEFRVICNEIGKGNAFEKAHLLRDRIAYTTDEGHKQSIELFDTVQWCKNEFQVTNQITMKHHYTNRYDVTILINGLPLVQIELKRGSIELKEAFNQVNRYDRDTFYTGIGLFRYIQIFVISNGENTKYYANNKKNMRKFNQTFYWTDKDNTVIHTLEKFTETFLERCHLAKMIAKYTVLHEVSRGLMVLRPYQYYAVEAIVERVKQSHKFGYIWHTTGSGKTLTSFKTAQLLMGVKEVKKILFVVDRRDLDSQTNEEFNKFKPESVDSIRNTRELVRQMSDPTIKLIVTTIQKLHNAIHKERYKSKIAGLKKERVVFIFDECHRSQFGKTHSAIKKFFGACQMFGFTGTPIFKENAVESDAEKKTTSMLFGDCLHKYVITDAIKDDNVLKFSVDYMDTIRRKRTAIKDIEVEAIDNKEVMDAPQRLKNIVDYIFEVHNSKTHHREFNSVFCVSSIENLIEYAKLFKQKNAESTNPLKYATIFTYRVNEDEEEDEAGGFGNTDHEELFSGELQNTGTMNFVSQREHLDAFIEDYNKEFGTSWDTRMQGGFYAYFQDVSKRMKSRQIDVLVVVNMFLTGFDAECVNTLYVDKNLRFHGLIQAFSRTNRISSIKKSHGNIVCFRNLKAKTDEAITLFSNKDAIDVIVMKPYDEYLLDYINQFEALIAFVSEPSKVHELISEEDQYTFVKLFREILRLRNVFKTFSEFDVGDESIAQYRYDEYYTQYIDLHDRVRRNYEQEKVSILDEVDFEMELVHQDIINVAYILRLLEHWHLSHGKEKEQVRTNILDTISKNIDLRSKRELIEKFMQRECLHNEYDYDIKTDFEGFMREEYKQATVKLSKEEGLDVDGLQAIIADFLYSRKKLLTDDILSIRNERTLLLERNSTGERIRNKIIQLIEQFDYQ